MAKGTNIRYPEHIRKFLEIESEKLGVPLSEVAIKTLDNAIKGNPILTSITGIEQQREQEKLGIERERHRKLKNDNDFFDHHGYYPTKPANFVTTVVEQPKPEQKVWYGSGYGQSIKSEPPKQNFSEFMPKKEITPEQWDRIYFNTITELSSGKFSCGICSSSITENKEEVKRHLHSVHGSEMLKLAKEFGFA